MNKMLNIAHISSECAPYAKTGGLGDVVQQLPNALAKMGHNVCTIIPLYGFLKRSLKKKVIFKNVPIQLRGKQYKASLVQTLVKNGNPIFFIDNEELFGRSNQIYTSENDGMRFLFFDVAALTFLNMLAEKRITPFTDGVIDIVHCHDWHAGLIPEMLENSKDFPYLVNTATSYTIHNLAYQGQTSWKRTPAKQVDHCISNPFHNKVQPRFLSFMKRGIMYADTVNTVSERYAQEILTKKYGQGLDPLLRAHKANVYGIINGVDYTVWNPQFDKSVYTKFSTETFSKKVQNKLMLQKELGLEVCVDIPMIGMSNRLSEQKGFGLLEYKIQQLLTLQMQLVIVGSGDKLYLKQFKAFAKKYPRCIAISSPFTETMASKVYAASDMYLMPSRFEPCGISQLISLRYGGVPIVHSTGGLHDTITDYDFRNDTGNGFTFPDFDASELLMTISRAIEAYQNSKAWKKLAIRGMRQSFSWDLPAKKYVELYEIAIEHMNMRTDSPKDRLKLIAVKKRVLA
jgi:starch synthase